MGLPGDTVSDKGTGNGHDRITGMISSKSRRSGEIFITKGVFREKNYICHSNDDAVVCFCVG
jgi:hypothetical protein